MKIRSVEMKILQYCRNCRILLGRWYATTVRKFHGNKLGDVSIVKGALSSINSQAQQLARQAADTYRFVVVHG